MAGNRFDRKRLKCTCKHENNSIIAYELTQNDLARTLVLSISLSTYNKERKNSNTYIVSMIGYQLKRIYCVHIKN